MRALGIDPGSLKTGYGLVERSGTRYVHIDSGVIRPPATAELPARLAYIHEQLTQILATHRVAEVAIENIFVYKNVQSAFVLGQARGVALCAAQQAGARIFEYMPTRVKQSTTGSGKASKEQMQQMVKVLLGLRELPAEDEADALAVSICHLNNFRLPTPSTPTRRP
jgi:crossover junction endodeoxyribonuclease RuvC